MASNSTSVVGGHCHGRTDLSPEQTLPWAFGYRSLPRTVRIDDRERRLHFEGVLKIRTWCFNHSPPKLPFSKLPLHPPSLFFLPSLRILYLMICRLLQETMISSPPPLHPYSWYSAGKITSHILDKHHISLFSMTSGGQTFPHQQVTNRTGLWPHCHFGFRCLLIHIRHNRW